MKYKNILIICLMICIVFCTSSVYANDLNDTNIQHNDPIMKIPNEDDLILKSNTGTFTDLNNEIKNAGSELKLTKNYTYNSTDSEFSNGIIITKPISIDGNGFTVNCNKESRAFIITSSTVVLKNIQFENCKGAYGGAIIFSNVKNCEIINSTFTNNYVGSTSSNSCGGCIYARSSDLNIKNTIFNGNYAYDKGGCIYASSSNLNIENNLFKHNYVIRGGSIYVSDSNLIINSTNFTNNHADYGGCIYTSSSTLKIENSNFIDNWAGNEGGTIFISKSTLNIHNSNFTKNKAKYGGSTIYSSVSMGILKNCIFKNNILTNKIGTPLDKQYVLKGCLINCDIDTDINVLIGGGLKDYTTQLKVIVTNNTADITVINPDYYNGNDYFLTIEKNPFPTSHKYESSNSLKLYDNHTIANIKNIQIGLNQYRVYYTNFYNDFYYYFNITKTQQSSITVDPITSQRGNNTLLKINVNDKSNVYSNEKKGYVSLSIDGKTYNLPVENGESELSITLPNKVGTFNYNVTFYPYSKYVYSSSTNLKIVSKYGIKISVKSVTGYQGKNVKIKATIKDDSGNKIKSGKIKFKIGVQEYTSNVKNGEASITIKCPKAYYDSKNSKTNGNYRFETTYYKSTYSCTASYNGDTKYMSNSTTFNVTSKMKPITHKYRIYNYRTFTLPVKNALKFYYKGSVVLAVGMKKLTTKNKLIIGVGDENDNPIPFKVQKHYKKNGKWRWDNWFKCDKNHYMESTYGTAIKIDKVRINCYSPYFVKIY